MTEKLQYSIRFLRNRSLRRVFAALLLIFIVALFGMLYCYFNYRFWTHLRTDDFKALTEYKSDNVVGLQGRQILVHKTFIPFIQDIDEYAQENNVKIVVIHSFRPEGKALSRTVAKPGSMSNHLAGYAIDFNVKHRRKNYLSHDLRRSNLDKLPDEIQNFITAIRNDKSLRWGGDFYPQDPVHIDHALNHNNRDIWQSYSRSCNEDFSNRVYRWKFWK